MPEEIFATHVFPKNHPVHPGQVVEFTNGVETIRALADVEAARKAHRERAIEDARGLVRGK